MAQLTTVARVKTWLNETATDATRDTLLGTILDGASLAMERYVGRTITSATYTGEKLSGSSCSDALILLHFPVSTFTSLSEDGAALASTDYSVDLDAGIVYRADGSTWDAGRFNYAATYTAGYATVPEDLQNAAIRQVVLEFKRSGYRGDRTGLFSTVLSDGSTASYRGDTWAEGVREVLDRYRSLR